MHGGAPVQGQALVQVLGLLLETKQRPSSCWGRQTGSQQSCDMSEGDKDHRGRARGQVLLLDRTLPSGRLGRLSHQRDMRARPAGSRGL